MHVYVLEIQVLHGTITVCIWIIYYCVSSISVSFCAVLQKLNLGMKIRKKCQIINVRLTQITV